MQPIKFSRILHGVSFFNSDKLSAIMDVATDDDVLNGIVIGCVDHRVLSRISDIVTCHDNSIPKEDYINGFLIEFSNSLKALLLTSTSIVTFDQVLRSDENCPKKDLYVFVIRVGSKCKGDVIFAVWSSCVELARVVILDWISKENMLNEEHKMVSDYFDFSSSCIFCIKHLG